MPRRYCARTCRPGRRLEGLAVEVLTALGERDAAVRDAERRAGEALQTMTLDEGLSVREAVEWCGSSVTAQEVTRLCQLAHDLPGGNDRSARDGSGRHGHSLSHQTGHLVGVVAAALCVELNGLVRGETTPFHKAKATHRSCRMSDRPAIPSSFHL
jgi:hypothetical protein